MGSDTQNAGIKWDEHGTPFSVEFDDQYFCKDSGYEEAVHVNCTGNALRERFRALDASTPGTFTIMETGFGTGLDFVVRHRFGMHARRLRGPCISYPLSGILYRRMRSRARWRFGRVCRCIKTRSLPVMCHRPGISLSSTLMTSEPG